METWFFYNPDNLHLQTWAPKMLHNSPSIVSLGPNLFFLVLFLFSMQKHDFKNFPLLPYKIPSSSLLTWFSLFSKKDDFTQPILS